MTSPPQDTELDLTLVLSGFDAGSYFMDRYRVEELLGSGAMGKVFQATDTVENRRVALKVLHPHMANKAHVAERFGREAQILRELGHPGIVRIEDAGRAPDGMDYLVMELLEGRTLGDRLRAGGPMSPTELLPLLVQVCDALGAAHVQGVVHRDLKPDNLFLVDDDRRVKIVDFGLSRLATDKRLTKTGMMLGTPRYMPPEQIRSAKDADERTDQYALGVIVHEALAGSSPFPASDAGQLLGCVLEGRILRLEEQVPGLPDALPDVVRKAMAKDRKDRFATIGGFVEAFARAIGRPTGRGGLLADPSELDALFSDADAFEGSSEVDFPVDFTAPEPPRFTLPSPAKRPAPVERVAREKRSAALGWGIFFFALIVVTCLSASLAFGIRGWLRADTSGIGSPLSPVESA